MINNRFRYLFRLLQIGVALIPVTVGVLAFLNDAGTFKSGVQTVVQPLITMHGIKGEAWRALPASWAPYVYTIMFSIELLVGIFALIGVLGMIKHFFKSSARFEQSKHWVYLACLWSAVVWGLGFFEIGGDWFLAWDSSNQAYSGIEQDSLNYVLLLFVVFVYLKLSKEAD